MRLNILGKNIISISCKKIRIITGEKSIPDSVGTALLTNLYKGSHSSSISENIG